MLPGMVPVIAGSRPDPTFAYINSYSNTADLTTYTFPACDLGAADGRRQIIVAAVHRSTGNFTRSVVSLTINGVAATAGLNTAIHTGAFIFAANVPTGATGDIVVSLSGDTNRMAIHVFRATNLKSLTPVDTVLTAVSDPSMVIDNEADGIIVGAAITSLASSYTWTGLTKHFDGSVETLGTTAAGNQFSSAATDRPISLDNPNGASATACSLASYR